MAQVIDIEYLPQEVTIVVQASIECLIELLDQGLDLVELGASTGTLVRLVDDLVSIIKMYKQ